MSGDSKFLLGFVAGVCIIGGLAPVRSAVGQPPAVGRRNRLPHTHRAGVPTPQTLETEDDFERARR